jgi:hypothetical protein
MHFLSSCIPKATHSSRRGPSELGNRTIKVRAAINFALQRMIGKGRAAPLNRQEARSGFLSLEIKTE